MLRILTARAARAAPAARAALAAPAARAALAVCAVLAVVAGVSATPARAQGDAPWCAVSYTGWQFFSHNCSFWSFEACYPHIVGGNRGFCQPNPNFRGPIPGLTGPSHGNRHWR